MTYGQLPESTLPELGGPGAGTFLYCPRCGGEFSATRGDYYWAAADEVIRCHNYDHRGVRPLLILARRHCHIEEVRP